MSWAEICLSHPPNDPWLSMPLSLCPKNLRTIVSAAAERVSQSWSSEVRTVPGHLLCLFLFVPKYPRTIGRCCYYLFSILICPSHLLCLSLFVPNWRDLWSKGFSIAKLCKDLRKLRSSGLCRRLESNCLYSQQRKAKVLLEAASQRHWDFDASVPSSNHMKQRPPNRLNP